VGAVRDLILVRNGQMFYGLVALVVAAALTNGALGQFRAGFAGQPLAHTATLWNFGGMVLAGLAFTLAGGCPGRQLFLSGEGDGDAAIFTLGLLTGAAVAHNFNLASAPAGPAPFGPAAVILGLVVCAAIGLTFREPAEAR
jgi:YedE family putative selenium metabolism protein